jgi:UPF0042 nucleotide-binding protein
MTRVALGIDVRVRAFLGEVGNVLQLLEAGGSATCRCSSSTPPTRRCFAASARRAARIRSPPRRATAPGARSRCSTASGSSASASRPLRARATRIIDTTNTSVHELRRILIAHFGPASGGAPRMVTRIVSFGFKYGTPVDADVVLDVRFLDNPYFVPELKKR